MDHSLKPSIDFNHLDFYLTEEERPNIPNTNQVETGSTNNPKDHLKAIKADEIVEGCIVYSRARAKSVGTHMGDVVSGVTGPARGTAVENVWRAIKSSRDSLSRGLAFQLQSLSYQYSAKLITHAKFA